MKCTFRQDWYTLGSGTGTGNEWCLFSPLFDIYLAALDGKLAGQVALMTSHISSIWHVFIWPVIRSLVHGVSTVTKHGKWSYKSKKGTGHVFYMPLPVTESVSCHYLTNTFYRNPDTLY